jgi:hypothetical protein
MVWRKLSILTSVILISAAGSLPAAAHADVIHDAATAAWTVRMPNNTQPITTPSGGALGIACYSASSSRSPLVDLQKDGTTIWSAAVSADADPCSGTAIADADGRSYAVISTPTGWALRAYSTLGAVRWTMPIDAGPWRTNRIALGWDGSVFLQLFDGRNVRVEGFSETTGDRTFDVSEYDGDGIYPYSSGIALAQPQGVEYYSYQGKEIGSIQLPALSAYEAYSAAGGANGTVFLAGWEGSCGSDQFSVSKATPAGLAWTKTDAHQTVCTQTSMSTTPDGGVVLAWSQGAGSWLYRSYGQSGSVRWTESPPGVPANGTSQGGYLAPLVDKTGNVGLPYEYSYTCADPSLTCQAFQMDFVSESTGGETLSAVAQENPPTDVQLDGADVGPGYLYIGVTKSNQSTGTTSSMIQGFAVPGLTLSYRVALEPGNSPSVSFVAMGDSYSSGEGLAPYLPGSHQNNPLDDCDRSLRTYGPLLDKAAKLGEMDFVACSGAVTRDLQHKNHGYIDEPAQMTALDRASRIVTLTIGGNDVGFASVLKACIRLRPFEWDGYGCSRNRTLVHNVDDRIKALAGVGAARSPDKTKIISIAALLEKIHRRAPSAHIYIAPYPHLFGIRKIYYKKSRSAPSHYACEVWRKGPAVASIDYTDAQWLNKQGAALDAAIKTGVDEARKQGVSAYFVRQAVPNFDRHGLCDAAKPWVNHLFINGTSPAPKSFHPTATGQSSGYEPAFLSAPGL